MLQLALATAGDVPAEHEPFLGGLCGEFPSFDYSIRDVLRAGEVLAGDMIWTDETADRIREVFSIANSWRDSHAYPMRKLRTVLYGQMRRLRIEGNTVARLKHMPSIRRKLVAHPGKQNQIHDLAGCRAILPSIKQVHSLIAAMRGNPTHFLYREYPYIGSPKDDGYRCHHLVFKFQGAGEEAVFNGRRVEIQIRTRLQHSWATAVETVGLFRRENMKAGLGSPEWLRLFKLMSAEFALAERCPGPPNIPDRAKRIAEIIELDKTLNAVNTLETLSHAVKFSDAAYVDPKSRPDYFLIKYDRGNRVVTVESQYGAIYSVRKYDQAELSAFQKGTKTGAVLVEADGIENLKSAYPNYFGDVQLFKEQLKLITQGADAVEYTLPPVALAPKVPKGQVDLSWFKRRKRWR